MGKRSVTDEDEIQRLLLDDPAFTEAVGRDDKGVFLMGGDGSKRYITQLDMVDDESVEETDQNS